MWTVSVLFWLSLAMVKGQGATQENKHWVLFKRIGSFGTDVYFHHLRIPVNVSQILELPIKVLETIKTCYKNIYQQSLMHYSSNPRNQYVNSYATTETEQLQLYTTEHHALFPSYKLREQIKVSRPAQRMKFILPLRHENEAQTNNSREPENGLKLFHPTNDDTKINQ
jgi:hypothetical protein